MSFVSNIRKRVSKFFSQDMITTTTGVIGATELTDNPNVDYYTNNLIKALNKCGSLLNVINPRLHINFSNLIYLIFTPYKKAINIRCIFLGTVKIDISETAKNKKQLSKIATFILDEIPVYDYNGIIPKTRGLNSLVNICSKDCDVWGMSFIQVQQNEITGYAEKIIVYKPDLFYFDTLNSKKQLLYMSENGDKVIDINTLYITVYNTVSGYDWGEPLIYGSSFLIESMVKLINAQINGLMRNMNPFDVTLISTDVQKLNELSAEDQLDVQRTLKGLKEDFKKSTNKALAGESVHLFGSIPALSSYNSSRGAGKINFVDSATFNDLFQLSVSGFGVPFELMMSTSGSMNTDKSKSALLFMEAWASEFGRPQTFPTFKGIALEIFNSYGIDPQDDVTIYMQKNETMLAGLNATTTETPVTPTV